MSAEDASLRRCRSRTRAKRCRSGLLWMGKLADLADERARRRQSLEEARTVLADIDAKVSARAALAEQQAQIRASQALAMRDLLVAALAASKGVDHDPNRVRWTAETMRWSELLYGSPGAGASRVHHHGWPLRKVRRARRRKAHDARTNFTHGCRNRRGRSDADRAIGARRLSRLLSYLAAGRP